MLAGLTYDERVALTERYYLTCYRFAAGSALFVCAASMMMAWLDQRRLPLTTVAIVLPVFALVAAGAGRTGYQLVRRHPYLPCVPVTLTLLFAVVLPSADVSALTVALSAPFALTACAAHRPRQLYGLLITGAISIAAGITLSSHGGAGQFVAAATATFLTGVLIKVAIHWHGLIVLTETEVPAMRQISPTPRNRELPATRMLRPATPPARLVALEAAHALANWMTAVRDMITQGQARRDAWYRITGFHARELQVLLLLDHHADTEVAAYLGISVKTVRNTAASALRRERAGLTPGNKEQVTRETLARELAATYVSVAEIELAVVEVVTVAPRSR